MAPLVALDSNNTAHTSEDIRKLIAQCQFGHIRDTGRAETASRRHRVVDRLGSAGVTNLLERYEHGGSASSLADDLGIPVHSVRKILTEQGGHNLRRDGQTLSPELTQLAVHLYRDEALSLAKVAEQINTTIHTIRKVLVADEVPLRGRYDTR